MLQSLTSQTEISRDVACQGETSGGRWLVVGDASLADVARTLAQGRSDDVTVVETENFLAALGELGKGSVDVVIGVASKLQGTNQTLAASLRELAPNATLIVAAHRHEQQAAQQAMASGFDRLLMLPANAQQLQRAITPTEPSRARVSIDALAQVEDSQRTSPLPADAELGDVDLVESVLRGKNELPAMMMRLIGAQSQIKGLSFVRARGDVPAGHASADLSFAKSNPGFLHAPPPTTDQQLQPWANWGSRWFAMYEQFEHFKLQAMRDELTDSWNRRYFNRFLKRILDWAHHDRSQVTLMVFDIDDFKLYNDRYGHAAGDDILREAARLMRSVCREQDVVARIGGDEFAVIFWDAEEQRRPHSHHPQNVVSAAHRFQKAICSHDFPKLLEEAPGTLTISGGLASFPWDGQTGAKLLAKADEMALASKRKGKNAITFGPGAAQVCQQEPCDPAPGT